MSHIPLMLTFFIFCVGYKFINSGNEFDSQTDGNVYSTCTGFGKFNDVCALNHPPLINHATYKNGSKATLDRNMHHHFVKRWPGVAKNLANPLVLLKNVGIGRSTWSLTSEIK